MSPDLKTLFMKWLLSGRPWYMKDEELTHVAAYTNAKAMNREMKQALRYGWTVQNTTSMAGHINVGRTLTKAALTGGVGLMLGASRTKDNLTVIYERTEEWKAAHPQG